MLLLHIFFLFSLNFVWVTSRNPAGVNYQDQFIQEIILRDVEDAASAGVKKETEAIQNSDNQGTLLVLIDFCPV